MTAVVVLTIVAVVTAVAVQLPIFTSSVQIALTSTRDTVLVDDVYVDPWLTN